MQCKLSSVSELCTLSARKRKCLRCPTKAPQIVCRANEKEVGNEKEVVDLGEAGMVKIASKGALHVVKSSFPLGMVLEQTEPGVTSVVDITNNGNAQRADVQVGDVLLCCSAAGRQMSFPAWQLVLGGGGVPATARIVAQTRDKPFAYVSEAIKSNMELDGRVDLVFERDRPSKDQTQSSIEEVTQAKKDRSMFSPELFR